MKTNIPVSLAISGYGTGVCAKVKARYFAKDIAVLCEAYGVVLCGHPFATSEDLFIVNKGTAFSDGAAKVMAGFAVPETTKQD